MLALKEGDHVPSHKRNEQNIALQVYTEHILWHLGE